MAEPLRVLLIEDSDAQVRLIKEMFADAPDGTDVTLTAAGRLDYGLEMLGSNPFDVVLLDLSLPDSTGIDTVRRACPNPAGVPVIVLTGFENEQLGSSAVLEGAQDYLTKDSLEPGPLLRSIKYGIERQRFITELKQLDELKSDFVASVSHELRTPLTSILGYLELLKDQGVENFSESQTNVLGVVVRNADRLLALVDDLLILTRIQARELDLSYAPLDLGAMAKEVCETIRPMAEESQIDLSISVPDSKVVVDGDEEQLARVLMNLLSNAVKFTPTGGRVGLELSTNGDHVNIAVADTGMGIAASDQKQLFTKFFRSSAVKQQAIPGTGLGLSIVKSLVEQHNGTIDVESAEGEGTKFTVRLPIANSR